MRATKPAVAVGSVLVDALKPTAPQQRNVNQNNQAQESSTTSEKPKKTTSKKERLIRTVNSGIQGARLLSSTPGTERLVTAGQRTLNDVLNGDAENQSSAQAATPQGEPHTTANGFSENPTAQVPEGQRDSAAETEALLAPEDGPDNAPRAAEVFPEGAAENGANAGGQLEFAIGVVEGHEKRIKDLIEAKEKEHKDTFPLWFLYRSSLKGEIKALERQLAYMREIDQELAERRAAGHYTVDDIIADLQARGKHAAALILSNHRESLQASGENVSLGKIAEVLAEKNREMLDRIRELDAELTAAKAQIGNLQYELGISNSRINTLESQVRERDNKIVTLEGQIATLQGQMGEKNTQIQQLMDDRDADRQRANDDRNKMSELTTWVSNLQRQLGERVAEGEVVPSQNEEIEGSTVEGGQAASPANMPVTSQCEDAEGVLTVAGRQAIQSASPANMPATPRGSAIGVPPSVSSSSVTQDMISLSTPSAAPTISDTTSIAETEVSEGFVNIQPGRSKV
jgi:DNA repair exonuclease SbcCD ATPase subunit